MIGIVYEIDLINPFDPGALGIVIDILLILIPHMDLIVWAAG